MPVRIIAIYTDEPLEEDHKTEPERPAFVLPDEYYIVHLTDEISSFRNQSYDPKQVPRLDISDLFKYEREKPVFVVPDDDHSVDLTDKNLSFRNQNYDPNQVPLLDISDLFKFDYKVDFVMGREVIDLTEE